MDFSPAEQQRLLAFLLPTAVDQVLAVLGAKLPMLRQVVTTPSDKEMVEQLGQLLADPEAARQTFSGLVAPILRDERLARGLLPKFVTRADVAHLLDGAAGPETPPPGTPDEDMLTAVLRGTWPAFIRHYCATNPDAPVLA